MFAVGRGSLIPSSPISVSARLPSWDNPSLSTSRPIQPVLTPLRPQVSPMGLINCLYGMLCVLVDCCVLWIVSLLLSTVCLLLRPITTMDDRHRRSKLTSAGTGRHPYLRSPEARHLSSQAGSGHVRNKSDANRWPEASPPALRWAARPDAIVVQGPVAKLNSAPLLNKFYPI